MSFTNEAIQRIRELLINSGFVEGPNWWFPKSPIRVQVFNGPNGQNVYVGTRKGPESVLLEKITLVFRGNESVMEIWDPKNTQNCQVAEADMPAYQQKVNWAIENLESTINFRENAKLERPGIYVGVRFDSETAQNIREWADKNAIPNAVPVNKLHATIIYSKDYFPGFEPLGDINPPVIVHPPYQFDLFGQGDEKCLVLKFKSDHLTQRHLHGRKLGARFDYDEYQPHITISYDYRGDIKKLKPPTFSLLINHEYLEPIKEDWGKTNAALGNPDGMPYGFWISDNGRVYDVDFEQHWRVAKLHAPDAPNYEQMSKGPNPYSSAEILMESGWIQISCLGRHDNLAMFSCRIGHTHRPTRAAIYALRTLINTYRPEESVAFEALDRTGYRTHTRKTFPARQVSAIMEWLKTYPIADETNASVVDHTNLERPGSLKVGPIKLPNKVELRESIRSTRPEIPNLKETVEEFINQVQKRQEEHLKQQKATHLQAASFVQTVEHWDQDHPKATLSADRIGLKPLPVLWYENEKGDRYIPDLQSNFPDMPDEKAYPYQHSRFGHVVQYHVNKTDVDSEGKRASREIMSGSSSYNDQLALALVNKEGFRLSDAIVLASECCSRCINVLAYKLGLDWGYSPTSQQAARANTLCEVCEQHDPEYHKATKARFDAQDAERERRAQGMQDRVVSYLLADPFVETVMAGIADQLVNRDIFDAYMRFNNFMDNKLVERWVKINEIRKQKHLDLTDKSNPLKTINRPSSAQQRRQRHEIFKKVSDPVYFDKIDEYMQGLIKEHHKDQEIPTTAPPLLKFLHQFDTRTPKNMNVPYERLAPKKQQKIDADQGTQLDS